MRNNEHNRRFITSGWARLIVADQQKSGDIIKDRRLNERSKCIITHAMQSCKSRNYFEKKLVKNGISVMFRQNGAGRIYGVTFIDYKQKVVFNGSRLGKAFSANAFHEKFNGTKNRNSEKFDAPEISQQKEIEKSNPMENITGILSLENQGENPEEENFIRRMKRKKRKQFKR